MNKIAEVLWNLIETIVRAVFGVILKIAHKRTERRAVGNLVPICEIRFGRCVEYHL